MNFHSWASIKEHIDAAEEDNRQSLLKKLLGKQPESNIYLIDSEDWRGSATVIVSLFEEEAIATVSESSYPEYFPIRTAVFPGMPKTFRKMSFAEVCEDEEMLTRIEWRLSRLLPYNYSELPDVEWFWFHGFNLAFVGSCLLWPYRDQSSDDSYVVAGPGAIEQMNHLHRPSNCEFIWEGEWLLLINSKGLSGAWSIEQGWVVPCGYRYVELDGRRYFELTSLDEIGLSEPITFTNVYSIDGLKRINPEGIQVVPGSHDLHVGWVIQKAGESLDSGLKGYMNLEGELLGGIRWKQAYKHYGRRASVQCPDSLKWGYVDDDCKVVIPPQFSSPATFNSKRAIVEKDGKWGVIDTDGSDRIQFEWRRISHFSIGYLVEHFDGLIGVLDGDGNTLVDLMAYYLGPNPYSDTSLDSALGEEGMRFFSEQLSASQRNKWSSLLKGQENLSVLCHQFKNGHGRLELKLAGLWGRRVKLIETVEESDRVFVAGTEGHVFFQYPCSDSMFDLSIECPIAGLGQGLLTLGVKWSKLALIDETSD